MKRFVKPLLALAATLIVLLAAHDPDTDVEEMEARYGGAAMRTAPDGVADQQPKLGFGARLSQSPVGKLLMPYVTPRAMVAAATKNRFGDPALVSDDLVDRFWELMRYPGNRQAAVDEMNTPRETEVWNDIENLKMPALILWGGRDVIFPLSYAHAFERRLSDSKLVVYPTAGHLPMLEQPGLVAADIDAFLRGS